MILIQGVVDHEFVYFFIRVIGNDFFFFFFCKTSILLVN